MTQHGRDLALKLIKDKNIDKGDGYENITARIDKKEWAMLTVLTKYFDLKANSVFTEILSKEIFDMVKSLNEEDLKEFKEKIKATCQSKGAKELLLESEIMDESPLFNFDWLKK